MRRVDVNLVYSVSKLLRTSWSTLRHEIFEPFYPAAKNTRYSFSAQHLSLYFLILGEIENR